MAIVVMPHSTKYYQNNVMLLLFLCFTYIPRTTIICKNCLNLCIQYLFLNVCLKDVFQVCPLKLYHIIYRSIFFVIIKFTIIVIIGNDNVTAMSQVFFFFLDYILNFLVKVVNSTVRALRYFSYIRSA